MDEDLSIINQRTQNEKIKNFFINNKNFDNEKILYLDTDKFFGENFLEYETEFNKLSSFLKFTYPRKKAVRTYLLYYNDRKKTYGHIDKQNNKKRLEK